MSNAFHQLGNNVELLTVERYVEWKNKKYIKDIPRHYDISSDITAVQNKLIF